MVVPGNDWTCRGERHRLDLDIGVNATQVGLTGRTEHKSTYPFPHALFLPIKIDSFRKKPLSNTVAVVCDLNDRSITQSDSFLAGIFLFSFCRSGSQLHLMSHRKKFWSLGVVPVQTCSHCNFVDRQHLRLEKLTGPDHATCLRAAPVVEEPLHRPAGCSDVSTQSCRQARQASMA
jgi:hypothetical protein